LAKLCEGNIAALYWLSKAKTNRKRRTR